MSTTPPPISSQVTAVGYGYDQAAPELYWNSSWQQVSGPPSAYSGYAWGGFGPERWGTNTITGSLPSGSDNYEGTITDMLYCTFNSNGGSNNFQVATGDSGGAVFYDGPHGWQLTGILLARTTYNSQPGGTAVYGNQSYFANLGSTYSQGSYYSQIMQEVLSDALPGDANLDGRVDINDLTVVLANYGLTGATWSQGEFSGSGTVDLNDLTIVLTNYGQTTGASGVASVPESSGVALLLAAAACLLAFAWRRRLATG